MSFRSFFHRSQRRSKVRRATRGHSFETFEDRRMLSFTPVGPYDAGDSPTYNIVSADFNDDGHLDLATPDYYSGKVNVLLGDGQGGMGSATSFDAGVGTWSVAVGDFNEDGKLDLATANMGDYSTGLPSVGVLLGNGDGTFGPVQSLPTWGARSVAVGDFNADGHLDLGVGGGSYGGGYYATLSVHDGDGDGNFAAPKGAIGGYFNAGIFESAAAADINGDGADDLVLGDARYGQGVYVFLGGDASGYLRQSDVLTVDDSQVTDVALGDLNGDGVLDVVAANYWNNPGISVFLSDGQGGYGTAQPYVGFDPGEAIALGDFTGDGHTDIVTASHILRGYGDGTFTNPEPIPAGGYGSAAGDMNGDGWLDVVSRDFTTVSVLLNDGVWTQLPPTAPPTISIGDAMVTEGNTGSTNTTFSVTLSKPTGVDVTVNYATANATSISGSDYTAKSGTVTIPAGQTSATISIAVLGDRVVEPTETFAVNLSAPANATIADGQGTSTILDDEPRISINDVSRSEGSKNTTTFTFTVSLLAAYDQAVTVNYSTANGTATAGNDYQSKSGSVVFAPGETTKTISVAVIGDRNREATESFFVNLSGANVGEITDSQGLGTILNDDGGGPKSKVSSSALAVDAAIEDWMLSGRKKRVM